MAWLFLVWRPPVMQPMWLIPLDDKKRCQFTWATFCFLIKEIILYIAIGKELLLLLFMATYLKKPPRAAPTQAFLQYMNYRLPNPPKLDYFIV